LAPGGDQVSTLLDGEYPALNRLGLFNILAVPSLGGSILAAKTPLSQLYAQPTAKSGLIAASTSPSPKERHFVGDWSNADLEFSIVNPFGQE